MRLVEEQDIKAKTVILRVDYNVPVDENGKITDNSRIVKSLRTIDFLLKNNCKIILISHFGRIKTQEDKLKYSLDIIAKEVSKLVKEEVVFFKHIDYSILSELNINKYNQRLFMLENTRFYNLDGNLEKDCNDNLSKAYASLAEVYINDAFGASHRKHASIYGIKKYLPSYYGFLINEEINNLNELVEIKKRPFTVFMGGAKVEDKLPIIKKLLEKCDYLCLGGGILNSFLKASGIDIKDSLSTENEEILKELKYLLTKYKEKIILSNKLIWSENKILDIQIDDYKKVLLKSKLVFINGTPGLFEIEKFSTGTKELFEVLKALKVTIIIGGGDTSLAIKKFHAESIATFISSGGGASLEYIANNGLGDILK